jgi:hypothetical protein
MPRHIEFYTPDQLDCNTMITSIGSDFGGLCDINVQFTRDQVIVVVKVRNIQTEGADQVMVQALVKVPLKTAKSLYQYIYSALLDCWHQMDRGVLGAATRPIEHGWNGRPQQPRLRK